MPNVWDVGTARIAREAGFPVIGTSSAAIATMLGGEDAEGTGRDEMLAWAHRIVRAAEPSAVNVDLESGYGLSVSELVDTVRGLGCAGINVEDTDHANGRLHDISAQTDRLRALATGLAQLHGHPVLTARVDSMLDVIHHDGRGDSTEADKAVHDAIERAGAYLDAGADVVFPIGLHTPRQLRGFLGRVPPERTAVLIPLTDARVGVVRGLGVSRISFGATPRDAADAYLRRRLNALNPQTSPIRRMMNAVGLGIGRLLRP